MDLTPLRSRQPNSGGLPTGSSKGWGGGVTATVPDAEPLLAFVLCVAAECRQP